MSTKKERCCKVLSNFLLICFVPSYLTLIIFSSIAVNKYDTQCAMSFDTFGILSTSIFIFLTINLLCMMCLQYANNNIHLRILLCATCSGFVTCGIILATKTIFSTCYAENSDTQSFITCTIVFVLSVSLGLMQIKTFFDTCCDVLKNIIKISHEIYNEHFSTEQHLKFLKLISFLGFIALLVSVSYAGAEFNKLSDPKTETLCNLSQVEFNVLSMLTLAGIGCTLVAFFNSYNVDIILFSQLENLCAFTLLCTIITGGYASLIAMFMNYTVFSNCFWNKYHNTFLMHIIIVEIGFGICISLIKILITLKFICKMLETTYLYVMTNDTSSSIRNPLISSETV